MLKAIWFVEPVLHGLARVDGVIERSGVAVEARLTGSSDEQFDALSDGSCDFAVTSMDNVILWQRREGGEGMRIVAQVEGTLAIDVVGRPEVQGIKGLAGARLLVDSAENGFVVALHKLLHDCGIDYGGCTVLESGGVRQRLAALLAGEGEAALLGPPFTQMAVGQGMQRLASVNEQFPGFAGQGIIIRTDMDAARADEFLRYLAVCDYSLASAKANPDAAGERLVAGSMPAPMASAMISALGSTLVPDPMGVEMLLDHRRSVARPGGEASYADLVDTSWLERAAALAH